MLKSPMASTSNALPKIEEKDAEISRYEIISTPESGSGTLGSNSSDAQSRSPSDEEVVKEYYPPFGQPIQRELELDARGLPLFPQPLPDENDPLTWSKRRKFNVLIHISLMSFLSQFLAMSIVSSPSTSCST
jgi:hypothetical protein